MSKLIINTKLYIFFLIFSGGVPFLNDHLLDLFEFSLFNIKTSDLLNYFDIFENFHKENQKEERLLSKYFQLKNIYLGFMDTENITGEIGSNEDNVYYLMTNTGKSKIKTDQFLKILNISNPNYVEIPYEFVKFLVKI